MDARSRFSTQFAIGALTLCLLLDGNATRADEAADQYAVATSHFAAKRWDLATTEFRAFLQRYPHASQANQAQYLLGESLVQQGQYRAAADTLAQLLEKKPEARLAAQAAFRRGESLHLVGDAAAAEPVLRAFLESHASDPSAVHALCYHGATLLTLGRPAAAEQQFDEALKRVSGGTIAEMCQLGKAQAAEALKRSDEAAATYERLSTAKAAGVANQARLRLGVLQSRRGQPAAAIATLQPLTEQTTRDTLHDDARYWLAISHQQAGHPQAALEMLQTWTTLSGPRADEARYRAAASLLSTGRKREAHTMLEKVTAGSPWADAALAMRIQMATADGDDSLWRSLQTEFDRRYPLSPRASDVAEAIARRLTQTGNSAEAIRLLESRLGDGRKDDEADRRRRYMLALAYHGLDRNDDALRQLDLALKSDNRELKARALQSQGSILLTMGHYQEAAAPLASCLELRPDGNDAVACRGNLAVCYARTGRLAEARELDAAVQKDFAKDRSRAAASLALAIAARDAGERTWAETLWRRVARSEATPTERAVALSELAKIEEARGRRDEAIQLYDRLVQQCPRCAEIDVALYQGAWLLHGAGREEEAQDRFRRLNQNYPQSRFWPDATYRLAEAALRLQQYDAVHCLVADICEHEQTSPEVLAHAMMLEIQRAAADQNWPAAEQSAEAFLNRLPQSNLAPAAAFWRAEAAYRQQHQDEATTRFAELASRKMTGHDSYLVLIPLRRGQLAATARDWDTARAMVAQLHHDWPVNTQQQEVDYLEGRCLAAEARFDEARTAYGRAVHSEQGKTETAAMAQWMIGESYLHQQRYDAALREYLRVEALYAYPQWQAAALIEAGKCYDALGRTADATEIYRRILDKYAQTTFREEAQKRLQTKAASPPPAVPRDAAAPPAPQGRTQQR